MPGPADESRDPSLRMLHCHIAAGPGSTVTELATGPDRDPGCQVSQWTEVTVITVGSLAVHAAGVRVALTAATLVIRFWFAVMVRDSLARAVRLGHGHAGSRSAPARGPEAVAPRHRAAALGQGHSG